MTLPAVLSKLVLMRIFMTACAVNILETGELLKLLTVIHTYLVAFLTLDSPVFSGKPEPGFIMTETRGRGESILVMAGKAIGRQGLHMVILVTGQAFRPESEVSCFLVFKLTIAYICGIMTIPAFFLCMRRRKWKAGKPVIE